MLDQDFCTFLECEISKALAQSEQKDLRGNWCDGVLLNQSELADVQKYVNDKRQLVFSAFVGKDGQTKYDLILKFGNKALSRFARNLDIRECFPEPSQELAFDFDTNRRRIEIQLE